MTTDDDVTRPKPEAPDLLAWMREFQASLPPADPAPPITEGQQQFWQQALLGLPPPEPPPAPAEPSAAELARELLRVHGAERLGELQKAIGATLAAEAPAPAATTAKPPPPPRRSRGNGKVRRRRAAKLLH